MSLTREERKLLHQKSQQPTFGSGKPNDDDGFNGDISYRKVEGSGTVQYLKENNSWTAISSSGEMPPIRIAGGGGGGGSSSSSGVTSHNDLTSLSADDHLQYLLIDGTRAMTSIVTIGADSDGTDRSITWGHSTLKTIMGIDDSSDAFVINTDAAFDATLANNSFSIDANHNVIIAGDVSVGDDLFLTSSGSIINWHSGDVTLTHATGKLTFGGDGTVELDFNSHEMTNVDINSGAIDGTTIGAASQAAGDFTAIGAVAAGTIVGTTIDATTDFTIDGLVITADTITNDATLTVDSAGDIILDANSGVTKFYLAGDTNDYASLTVAANGVTTLATFDNGGTVGHLTLDADGDIILDAAGKDISLTDGSGTAEFIFNLEAAPELDVDGAFTIDGSSTITLDSVADFIVKTRDTQRMSVDDAGHIYFHAYNQTLFSDYYINIKAVNKHLTSGTADFQQNYSWIGKHFETANGTFNANYGT